MGICSLLAGFDIIRRMVIDIHTHIFPPAVKSERAKFAKADARFAEIYAHEKARIITAEELIDSMDSDGVDVSAALNFGWTTMELCCETNDYILEAAARFPKRFVGFCSVLLDGGSAAVKEVERCAKAGAKGIGELRCSTEVLSAASLPKMKPVIDAIISHGLILLTHSSEPVGHQYAGKGDMTPEKLFPLISAFPELKLVCAHWGGGLPFYALMPEVKEAFRNVYFDTAASPYLYNVQIYSRVADLVGADKILFGSDYPLMSQKRPLKEVRSLDLPEATKDLILSGNARRLLGI